MQTARQASVVRPELRGSQERPILLGMAESGLALARQLRRDAAREQILEAAWELTSRRGLRGLSMRGLAEMLRIDHQRIYTHFPSKRDLYRALLARRFPASPEEWDAVGIHDPGVLPAGTAAAHMDRHDRRSAVLLAQLPMTAVDAIEMCTAEAERGGHVLGGFVRRSRSVTFRFAARCRVCGDEMSVRRTAAGWIHAADTAPCRS